MKSHFYHGYTLQSRNVLKTAFFRLDGLWSSREISVRKLTFSETHAIPKTRKTIPGNHALSWPQSLCRTNQMSRPLSTEEMDSLVKSPPLARTLPPPPPPRGVYIDRCITCDQAALLPLLFGRGGKKNAWSQVTVTQTRTIINSGWPCLKGFLRWPRRVTHHTCKLKMLLQTKNFTCKLKIVYAN